MDHLLHLRKIHVHLEHKDFLALTFIVGAGDVNSVMSFRQFLDDSGVWVWRKNVQKGGVTIVSAGTQVKSRSEVERYYKLVSGFLEQGKELNFWVGNPACKVSGWEHESFIQFEDESKNQPFSLFSKRIRDW